MLRPESIGNENWTRCGFRDCHQCCLETEMILTQEDLLRIEAAGHKREDFILPLEESDNFLQLRNVESPLGKKCYFLKHICCRIRLGTRWNLGEISSDTYYPYRTF